MGRAIGDTLPLAIGVAISPVPIIAIVLMLGTPQARSDGIAFTAGWILGLSVIGTVMLVVASGHETTSSGTPETWVSLLKLLIGVMFLLIAARQWRSRPKAGQEAVMPKWMQTIDTFRAGKAFGGGVLLSAVNPKNLALTIAAAAAIAELGISNGEEAGAMAVFVAIGSVTIIAPLVLYLVLGTRARETLEGIKRWMAANNAVIMTVLLLVLGAKLIGDAITGLSS
jgi:threonine/homoserine/homoserine lactone efflux protein